MATADFPPLCIHPENPKVFLFRGRPLVLVTATEHYGAVMNRPFRFERYLADAADKGITLTRLFVLFRELQSALNPYSTCKPDSPDYIAPFRRSGPELAFDGQPKYDLNQWNVEFFKRLDRFLSLAAEYEIIVEITLLSNVYHPGVWMLQPLHPANNLDGMEDIEWYDYMSQRHPRLFARQCAHVREIVERTNRFDNVIYEVCNEPGGLAAPGAPSLEEVNDWQMAIAGLIRETEANLPCRHLIAGQEAFAYQLPEDSRRSGPDVYQFADQSFASLAFDVVNMHPLSNMVYRGQYYDLGQFMQGHLRLRNLRQYCLDLYQEGKPLNLDEDNAASQYKDLTGWTIHRKRAWTALLCGAHYDYIDFTINNYCETGTPASQQAIRAWMGHLARFVHSVDLVRARPRPELLLDHPQHTAASVLVVECEDYVIYLADAREQGECGLGEALDGDIVLSLPEASFRVSCYSPLSGLYSPALSLTGSARTRIMLPQFQHDLVVRIRRGE